MGLLRFWGPASLHPHLEQAECVAWGKSVLQLSAGCPSPAPHLSSSSPVIRQLVLWVSGAATACSSHLHS